MRRCTHWLLKSERATEGAIIRIDETGYGERRREGAVRGFYAGKTRVWLRWLEIPIAVTKSTRDGFRSGLGLRADCYCCSAASSFYALPAISRF